MRERECGRARVGERPFTPRSRDGARHVRARAVFEATSDDDDVHRKCARHRTVIRACVGGNASGEEASERALRATMGDDAKRQPNEPLAWHHTRAFLDAEGNITRDEEDARGEFERGDGERVETLERDDGSDEAGKTRVESIL